MLDAVTITIGLLLIEGAVLLLARHERTKRLFSVLPPMFWIYLLPGVAALLGLLPSKSPVYSALVRYALPASLALLFLSVDLRAVWRLGRDALLMMAASSLGIVLGGPAVLLIFGRWLPEGIWSGFGALSASWLGGSANMIAVKESIGTPDDVFVLMVIVDVVVAYGWMGLVLSLARQQGRYDRLIDARTAVLEEIGERLETAAEQRRSFSLPHLPLILLLAAAASAAALLLGGALPEVPGAVTTYTWTVLAVTALGILLSFTRARELEERGASEVGYVLLYLVLAAIGARADLTTVTRAPILILSGAVWVLLHALLLALASRLFRAPMFLAATASQANIGGLASAPIVAATYQPSLAQVGLLLAVLGNACGTYLGILCAALCRLVAGAR